MKKYVIGFALITILSINSDVLKASPTEEAISDFDNLPKLTIAEKASTALKASLAPAVITLNIKRLLKAVMYIDARLRKIEVKEGISAPALKEVTSVRDALTGITETTEASPSQD